MELTKEEALQLLGLEEPFTAIQLEDAFAEIQHHCQVVVQASPEQLERLKIAERLLSTYTIAENLLDGSLKIKNREEEYFSKLIILPKLNDLILTAQEEDEIYRVGQSLGINKDRIAALVTESMSETGSVRQLIDESSFIQYVIAPKFDDKILTEAEEDEIYRIGIEQGLSRERLQILIEERLRKTGSVRQNIDLDLFLRLVILPKLYNKYLSAIAEDEILRVGQEQLIDENKVRYLIWQCLQSTGSGREKGPLQIDKLVPLEPVLSAPVAVIKEPLSLPPLSDGTCLWTFATKAAIRSSPALGPDGSLYVGSQDGRLYALSQEGNLNWIYSTGGEIHSSPVVSVEGVIYIASRDGKIYALQPTGFLEWSFETHSEMDATPALAPNGMLYVGCDNGQVLAVTHHGEKAWAFRTKGQILASIAVAPDNTIYVACQDGLLYALQPDGELKWSFAADGALFASPAIATDGTIYTGSQDHYLYALTPDGQLKWRYQTGDWIVSSPVLTADGSVLFGSNDCHLYALSASGDLQWRLASTDWFYGAAAVGSTGMLYVGNDDKHLYAVSPEGQVAWRVPTRGEVRSGPLLHEGILFVGSEDHRLYAIKVADESLAASSWPRFQQGPANRGCLIL